MAIPQMTAAHPDGIRVVEDFLDALGALDIDRASNMLSHDVVYHNVPFPADVGKPAAERTLRMFARLDHFEVRIHNIAQRGDIVLTERTDIVRSKLLDLSFWVCGTFEVHNGQISLWRDRFDVGNVLFQFATSPLRMLRRR